MIAFRKPSTRHFKYSEQPLLRCVSACSCDGSRGEVNGFTTDRSTYFYAQFDLRDNIRRASNIDEAASAIEAVKAEDVEDGVQRFAALFAGTRPDPRVLPSPATHWASVQLKAGETVCRTPFGSKTV